MASRIKGITVEIGGDTSGLERALSDARWLTKDTLYNVQWLLADITLIERIEKQMKY